MTTPAVLLEKAAKSAHLLNNHFRAGHDLSNRKLVTDLRSGLTNIRRLLYTIEPPATQREILSYLVSTLSDLKEHFVSVIGDQIQAAADKTGAAADAAANRVIEAINANNAVIAELQAKSDADDAAIAELQAQIDSGTITPEAAQAVVDSLEATNAKLADLDSDPLTPV